ncbi:MAG: vanadium-dependent haloperoxidase [Microcoleus sp. PH2017_10_PVI_O_A]|uniref:vanadium-dependent haloperoxidase n=1 Tax=unclassified Microcoleus TaxID=2642155 RepID=UPI001D7F1531|nr:MULTISPECIES: vanadium-dependent haloperoxidase [unclassified Microcoleus]TAE84960.1 MAG: phosphatase PAP2 family protein [Oscillatoriales cyanobacterium]MCC3404307.1 vanadium-dependent haloperoxidase [Microcoleus sp. PH2017_10_PVI_O_A]MCC3458396.1 vanadium-dependent haloperoxidase [Microcoleus sp. PH2017_11_PCY_U_A]MCC3476734.1 vanadium-dependent haloperoxidase [Microcoleus sp. PH2017_12_PCY_D_A]MCC3526873.1 vanadium-dependent haloperoxidase [Microcoleus sp. PH2017_21_RUC_O_A]
MNLKPRKSLNSTLVLVCLAVSSIAGTANISSKLQETALLSLLQPESAIAQSPIRESQDAIVRWNALTLDIIKTEKTSPPMAARNLAMVHAAVYDAANAVSQTHKVYKVPVQPPAGTSAEAAAVAAAHRVLANLYPKQTATLDAAKTASLTAIAEGKSKTDGVQLGEFVAGKILEWRKDDGANTEVTYTPVNQPGYWQPIPPDLKPASMPHWKNVKPFAMTKGSQFQIANMPSLTSEEYTAEFNKLKELGAKDSKTRTADQSAIAKFWLNNPGTVTPPGHWNQIAADIAVRRSNTFEQNLRLFAVLNIALADASIIDGDQKYTFNRWRPLTGIQQADKDGNPQTTADANWTPLLNTPSSPAYVSGHSTFGGAADAVLTAFFGDNVSFTAVADASVNLQPRAFKSLTEAAEEAGMSRVYGGAHWPSDNRDGLKAGRNLGKYVMEKF